MNKVFLSGVLCSEPEIKFTENLVNVKFFVMDTQGEKYECFAIDGPAFWIAGKKQIEHVFVCGKLCNYRYRDASNTMHKSKYIFVYDLEEGDILSKEIEDTKIEQLNRKLEIFLEMGYSPLSKIIDAYVQEV